MSHIRLDSTLKSNNSDVMDDAVEGQGMFDEPSRRNSIKTGSYVPEGALRKVEHFGASETFAQHVGNKSKSAIAGGQAAHKDHTSAASTNSAMSIDYEYAFDSSTNDADSDDSMDDFMAQLKTRNNIAEKMNTEGAVVEQTPQINLNRCQLITDTMNGVDLARAISLLPILHLPKGWKLTLSCMLADVRATVPPASYEQLKSQLSVRYISLKVRLVG
jgi:hypothetical protein